MARRFEVTPAQRDAGLRLTDKHLRPKGTRQRYHFGTLRVGESAFLVWPQYGSRESVQSAAYTYARKHPGVSLIVAASRDPMGVFVYRRT